jgi:hypothetical protein
VWVRHSIGFRVEGGRPQNIENLTMRIGLYGVMAIGDSSKPLRKISALVVVFD